MPREKIEIIKDLNECEVLYNRLVMDIGQGYALYSRTKDDRLISVINDRVELFQKAEVQKRLLENELKDLGE